MKKEGYYRLEYNEKQQHWHHNRGNHEPNTNDWFTVIEHCDDFYIKFFENYIKKEKKPYTKKYLLKCAKEVSDLFYNLEQGQIKITIDWIKR
jgi:hypothetical protein